MNERLGFTSRRRGHPRLSKDIGTLTPRGRRGLECVMRQLFAGFPLGKVFAGFPLGKVFAGFPLGKVFAGFPRGKVFAGSPRGDLMMSLGCLLLLSMAAGCPTTAMPDASIGNDAQVSDAGPTSDVPGAIDAFVAVDAPLAVDAFAPSDAPASIAIAGSYTDGFGTHTVSNTRWQMGGGFTAGFAISRFDNSSGFALAQNDTTNMFSPSMWSRFEWFTVGTTLYMCQGPFDAASESAALSAPRANRSSPATSGCGGAFPWSVLTPT